MSASFCGVVLFVVDNVVVDDDDVEDIDAEDSDERIRCTFDSASHPPLQKYSLEHCIINLIWVYYMGTSVTSVVCIEGQKFIYNFGLV